MGKTIRRGEVWFHKPTYSPSGHILRGSRPVIVVSNEQLNRVSEVVLGVPCTTRIRKNFPTHVLLVINDTVSCALTDQVGPYNIHELENRMYVLEDYKMKEIDNALDITLGKIPMPRVAAYATAKGDAVQPDPEPVGDQVVKFYNRYPQVKPPRTEPKQDTPTPQKNKWDEEAMWKFLSDFNKLSTEELCAKYRLTEASVYTYYRKFTRKISQKKK